MSESLRGAKGEEGEFDPALDWSEAAMVWGFDDSQHWTACAGGQWYFERKESIYISIYTKERMERAGGPEASRREDSCFEERGEKERKYLHINTECVCMFIVLSLYYVCWPSSYSVLAAAALSLSLSFLLWETNAWTPSEHLLVSTRSIRGLIIVEPLSIHTALANCRENEKATPQGGQPVG